jgi:integrase
MSQKPPKYALHKATGQARVRINGKSIYLGPYGSEESRRRYDELVADMLKGRLNVSSHKLTIAQLSIAFVKFARTYYVKNGRITSEVSNIQTALRPLVKTHGRCLVAEFGPAKLKQARDLMIQNGIVRKSVNRGVGRIKRMFRWGVENEMVSPNILAAINAVPGLRFGRSAAVDAEPVKPVCPKYITAIQSKVNRFVWGMIQLQLTTGMRPGEVRLMRMCDLHMSDKVWEYRPQEHKTEHHGRQRLIFIGPKGQEILRPFLCDDPEQYVFSPCIAEKERNEERRMNRSTPMTPSQAARQEKSDRRRKPGKCYTVFSYGRAIRNACIAAEVPVWTPGQLRHNAATELRKTYDIETVRTILGHATGFTTEVYAELDFAKARSVIGRVG